MPAAGPPRPERSRSAGDSIPPAATTTVGASTVSSTGSPSAPVVRARTPAARPSSTRTRSTAQSTTKRAPAAAASWQVGDERRLLAPVLAAGVAVAAVARVGRRRVLRGISRCVRPRALERLGHQLVRPVRLRLVGVDVDPRRDRVEVRVEVRAVDAGEPERGPLGSYRLRRPQADERVDDRPAAERRAREQADRAALAEEEPAPQVELPGADRLELPEVRLVAVAAALEHEHRAAGRGRARPRSRRRRRRSRSRRRRRAASPGARQAGRRASSSAPRRPGGGSDVGPG